MGTCSRSTSLPSQANRKPLSYADTDATQTSYVRQDSSLSNKSAFNAYSPQPQSYHKLSLSKPSAATLHELSESERFVSNKCGTHVRADSTTGGSNTLSSPEFEHCSSEATELLRIDSVDSESNVEAPPQQ